MFVKESLTLNGDMGIKEDVVSVSAGSLMGTVAVGEKRLSDGFGAALANLTVMWRGTHSRVPGPLRVL